MCELYELNRTVRNGYSYITLPFPNDLQHVRHDKEKNPTKSVCDVKWIVCMKQKYSVYEN